jgi:hypothetical protein
VINRFKARQLGRYGEGRSKTERSLWRFGTRRRRRRWFGGFMLLLTFLLGAYALGYSSDSISSEGTFFGLFGSPEAPSTSSGENAEQDAGPPPDSSPAAAAYAVVAPEYADMSLENVQGVYKSKLDPSWASVHLTVPDEESIYVVFVRQVDGSWKALKSIRADEPENPEYEKVVLDEVPEDLVDSVYPPDEATEVSGLLAEPVDPGTLPNVKAAEVSSPEPVTDEVPGSELERVEEGLEEAQQRIKDYDGVAGLYVWDLKGGYGYGVRPDEVFFNASVAKVPIMVAVFRKIDEGEISLNYSFETESEDWAAGAGGMQFQPIGTSTPWRTTC